MNDTGVYLLLQKQVFELISENLKVIPSLKELCQYKLHKYISTATLQKQKSFYLLRNVYTCCCSLQFFTKQELLFNVS